jgi:hypothetical protein
MLTARDELKIVDFGIAKVLDDLSARGFRTLEGTAIGTPEYMAPEQAAALEVGWWTDLYSAGIVGWELLVGRPPFSGDAPSVVMHRHLNEDVPAARSANGAIDPGISRWLERMTARQPHDRWPSGKRAWEELEGLVSESLGPDWRAGARLGAAAEAAPAAAAPPSKAVFPVDGTRDWATPPVIPDPAKPGPWRLLAGVAAGGLAVIVGVLGFLRLDTSSSSAPILPTDVPAARNWLRASTGASASLWVTDPRGSIERLTGSGRLRTAYDLPDPERPVAAVSTAGGMWFGDAEGVTFVPHKGAPLPNYDHPNTRLLVPAAPRTVVAADVHNRICVYSEATTTPPKCISVGLPIQGLGATARTIFVAVQIGSQPAVVRRYSLRTRQFTGLIVLHQLVPAGSTLVADHRLLYVPVAYAVAVADLRTDTEEVSTVALPDTPTSLTVASGVVYAALYKANKVAWWRAGTTTPVTAPAAGAVAVTVSGPKVEVVGAGATRLLGQLDMAHRRVVYTQSVGVPNGQSVQRVSFSSIAPKPASGSTVRTLISLASGRLTAADELPQETYWQPGIVKPRRPMTNRQPGLRVTLKGVSPRAYPAVAVITHAVGKTTFTIAPGGSGIVVTAR